MQMDIDEATVIIASLQSQRDLLCERIRELQRQLEHSKWQAGIYKEIAAELQTTKSLR